MKPNLSFRNCGLLALAWCLLALTHPSSLITPRARAQGVSRPPAVSNLRDVLLNTPSAGQTLQYDATTGRWTNATPAASSSTNGGTVTSLSSGAAGFSFTNPTTTPILGVSDAALARATLGALGLTNVVGSGVTTNGDVLTISGGGGSGSGTVTNVSSATASLTVADGSVAPVLTLGTVAITNGGTGGTNVILARQSLDVVGRGQSIPVGVVFWDDFQRTNTAPGFISAAPSVSPATGTNYLWQTNPAFSTYHKSYITNGMLVFKDDEIASHTMVDLGFKPTYFGCRLRRTDAGGSLYPQFVFLLSPSSNSIDGAYHFGIFPGIYPNIGFWQGTLTNILTAFPTNYVSPASGEDITFQFWIDGETATFDWGGSISKITDPRFASFGGRYFDAEFYKGDTNSSVYIPSISSVWAGVNFFLAPTNNYGTLTATNLNATNATFATVSTTNLIGTSFNLVQTGITTNIGGYRITNGSLTLFNGQIQASAGYGITFNAPGNVAAHSGGLQSDNAVIWNLYDSTVYLVESNLVYGWGVTTNGAWVPRTNQDIGTVSYPAGRVFAAGATFTGTTSNNGTFISGTSSFIGNIVTNLLPFLTLTNSAGVARTAGLPVVFLTNSSGFELISTATFTNLALITPSFRGAMNWTNAGDATSDGFTMGLSNSTGRFQSMYSNGVLVAGVSNGGSIFTASNLVFLVAGAQIRYPANTLDFIDTGGTSFMRLNKTSASMILASTISNIFFSSGANFTTADAGWGRVRAGVLAPLNASGLVGGLQPLFLTNSAAITNQSPFGFGLTNDAGVATNINQRSTFVFEVVKNASATGNASLTVTVTNGATITTNRWGTGAFAGALETNTVFFKMHPTNIYGFQTNVVGTGASITTTAHQLWGE